VAVKLWLCVSHAVFDLHVSVIFVIASNGIGLVGTTDMYAIAMVA
jgi:hypothetical protein